MKVSGKVYGLVFSGAISLVMSVFMSFFMVLVNVGYIDGFFFIWMMSTALGFAIALPIAAIAVPIIQKLLNRYLIVKDNFK